MIHGFEFKVKQIITVTPRLIEFDFITLDPCLIKYETKC
jgi:hypothetical protein